MTNVKIENPPPPSAAGGPVRDLLQQSPAVLLLLYVSGYIAANSHYARYEMVKTTLLTGRYLAAGLLYMVFAAVPAAVGFAYPLHAGMHKGANSVKWAVLLAVLYVTSLALYSGLVIQNTTIGSRWWSGAFMASTAIIGALVSWGILQSKLDVRDPTARVFDRIFKLITQFAIPMMAAAFIFGGAIYPSIHPSFGGAAVLEGYVILIPEAPAELRFMMEAQPLPFVDQDERFLYVVACREPLGSTKPGVIMIPLDFIAAASINSPTSGRFVSVPSYIKEHGCDMRA